MKFILLAAVFISIVLPVAAQLKGNFNDRKLAETINRLTNRSAAGLVERRDEDGGGKCFNRRQNSDGGRRGNPQRDSFTDRYFRRTNSYRAFGQFRLLPL